MADNVNPAAATGATSTISFNLNYVTSLPGLLKILEIIFGLISWALIASIFGYGRFAAYQFIMFVFVTSWILTIITFIIFLFAIHANACSGAPWLIIEFAHNALWGLLYFIAACVDAAYAGSSALLGASTVFAFFTTIVYIVHTFISFKEWRGGFPWQSTTGSSVNT